MSVPWQRVLNLGSEQSSVVLVVRALLLPEQERPGPGGGAGRGC